MLFSAALLSSTLLGFASAQCPDFGRVTNPAPLPNPSVFFSASNAFFSDNIYNFALNLAPSSVSAVTVSTSISNPRLMVRPATLTFNSSNFAIPQPIEIVAINNLNMSPIIGATPLSLTFTSSRQSYSNTTCMPSTDIRSITVPLTLNSKNRGGVPLTPVSSVTCSSVFGGIVNTNIPAPYAWVTPKATSYSDNILRFVPNFSLTSTVTFSVVTSNNAIVASPATFTVTPDQASGKVPFDITLSLAASLTQATSAVSFPYKTSVSFIPQGQSFGFPPVSYDLVMNGERNELGVGGFCPPCCRAGTC